MQGFCYFLADRKSDGNRPDSAIDQAHIIDNLFVVCLFEKAIEGAKTANSNHHQIGGGALVKLNARQVIGLIEEFLAFGRRSNAINQLTAVRRNSI